MRLWHPPDHLSFALLLAFALAGCKPQVRPLREMALKPKQAVSKEGVSFPYKAGSRPSSSEQTRASFGSGRWESEGADLRNELGNAFDVPGSRIVVTGGLPDVGRQDIVIQMSKEHVADLKSVAQREIPAAFGVRAALVEQEMDVWVLTATDRTSASLRLSNRQGGGVTASPGNVQGSGASMEALAGAVEPLLGRPVVDETDIGGYYDFDLRFVSSSPVEEIKKAIQSNLGLNLSPARRRVKILQVSRQ